MRGKTILITGGTGSIGQKLTERIFKKRPKKVIVFSRDEAKQVDMQLKFPNPGYPVRYILGDIRDRQSLYRAFSNIDVVIHAAALKHVPKCEYSPFEAVKTNVLGAQNIIDAAIDRRVKKVLAISTDKSTNPINLYGATKLCADKLFIAGNNYSGKHGSIFSVIRFGNYVMSRGSVIPLFQKLKAKGQTVFPITSTQMTRFMISLDAACDRIFEALRLMKGGEVFSPKMPSMKITDIAKAVDPNCTWKEIGIRDGEKLNEDMIVNADAAKTYDYKNFYITYSRGKGQGKLVAPDFEYRSDTNGQWMDAVSLEGMI